VSAVVTVAVVLALYVAACVDFRREQTAARALCPCGCGNSIHKHNPPRSHR
jgi:hypothetical protein